MKRPLVPRIDSGAKLALLAAVAAAAYFWVPVRSGAGILGGDTHTYFFPQKTFLVDPFAAGEFPLWNNLVANGYPVIAESQTGACYPITLLLYSTLDLNSAHNA